MPPISTAHQNPDLSAAKLPCVPGAAVKLEVALQEIRAARLSGDDSAIAVHKAFDTVGRFARDFLQKRHPLKDDGQIEDISQEVLIRVWRNITSYDPSRDPEPWLGAIAARAAIDAWRRNGRSRAILWDFSPDDNEVSRHRGITDFRHPADTREKEPPVDFFAREHQREIRELFLAALPTLPTHVRETMTLRMEGLSNEEIAEALQVPMGTVKSRAHLGMKKLKEALAKYPFG
jgi:RNA polymerase sigma-70 factor (ECF subfamily)